VHGIVALEGALDSEVAAAWISIIPTLAGLLLVAVVVVANRRQLSDLLAKVTRVSIAGVQLDLDTDQLKRAKPEQPVTEASASALEARISRNAGLVRGRRVLWVDDKPQGNASERRFLRSAGICVENATSTAEALARLELDEYDAVITNQKREGSDRAGEELAEQARAAGETVPFVAYILHRDPRPTPVVFWAVTDRPDELVHILLDIFERAAATGEAAGTRAASRP
jgi:CheY-like chemotaxis protein